MKDRVTIAVNLEPETEETVRRWAAEVGDDPETYLARVVNCGVRAARAGTSTIWPLGIPLEEFHAIIRADRTAYLGQRPQET